MSTTRDAVIAAHKYCNNNKESLMGDKLCGCFYCLRIFSPAEIEHWIDSRHDSVIGESAGYPITEDFLKEMNRYWF